MDKNTLYYLITGTEEEKKVIPWEKEKFYGGAPKLRYRKENRDKSKKVDFRLAVNYGAKSSIFEIEVFIFENNKVTKIERYSFSSINLVEEYVTEKTKEVFGIDK